MEALLSGEVTMTMHSLCLPHNGARRQASLSHREERGEAEGGDGHELLRKEREEARAIEEEGLATERAPATARRGERQSGAADA